MNSDLTHLPQNKQDDLRQITAIVRQHCPQAGMIILFGSYARGDYRELKDLAPDRKSGHPSDYDILVVVNVVNAANQESDAGAAAQQQIENECIAAGLSATPRFIYHDLSYLNRKLEIGQYFFSDIVNEGKLLYGAEGIKLAGARELSAKERLNIAQEDFAEWFGSAKEFFEGYRFYHSKGYLKKAAFSLHQSTEAAYKAALIIFTGYLPDEHYLALLGRQASKIDPAFDARAIFQTDSELGYDAFTTLEYAYIGARYEKRYSVDATTVRYLADRVEVLLELTERLCDEKIAVLEKALT
ncbi:MAG: HEPN domain-containing protein [Reinekea sp.]